MSDRFDPGQHLRPMKGGAEYLDVKWRLVWLRQEHPDAEIETRALEHEPGKWAAFWARVAIPGAGSATGHGSESAGDFRDYYEKAETKALGRALAALGYGTQFVGNDLDEGERIVDAPVERPGTRMAPRMAPTRAERPQERREAPEAGADTPAPALDGWTAVWTEARRRGIHDREALARFMGQNAAALEPAAILARLREAPAGGPLFAGHAG